MHTHRLPAQKTVIFILLFFSAIISPALSLDQTVGLLTCDSASFLGYTLFTPISSSSTYLIDNYGRLVHEWHNDHTPGLSCYLLENGNLLRTMHLIGTGGAGGGFQMIDWDGNILWEYEYYGDDHLQHHDVEYLPNGNVLVLAWEKKTFEEAVNAGRNPALLANDTLLPEHVVEIQHTGVNSGNIVWEWHLWDHLVQDFDSTKDNFGVVANHPELVDINYILANRADWIHANSVQYNADLDQIIINSRSFDEFWIIDHGTTTAEAAGHTGGNRGRGGDILYRWGNPATYRAGNINDKRLFKQHDAHWIAPGLPGEGHIMIFNNGTGRLDGNYSTVDEIITPVDESGNYTLPDPGEYFGPDSAVWKYKAGPPSSFLARRISGSQRFANGNTLICSGVQGRFFEVTPDGDIVWEYINPVTANGIATQGDLLQQEINDVFRCYRYAPDFPGLAGHDLTPGAPIEIYPLSLYGTNHIPENPERLDPVTFSAMITCEIAIAQVELYIDTGDGFHAFTMTTTGGFPNDSVYTATVPPLPAGIDIAYYVTAVNDTGGTASDPVIAPLTTYHFTVAFICGDPNNSGSVNILDVTCLINYLYRDGSSPVPEESGDVNNSGGVNILDATYLINYIYRSGPDPVCP
nr:aryl-sulfate sulfotransferase [candidate division Zixibacteria bacterium]